MEWKKKSQLQQQSLGLRLQYQKKLESGTKPQKKKNDKTLPAKEGYDVFQEGKDNFPPLNYTIQKEEIKMKHIIIILVVVLIVWYSGGNKNDN